MHKWLFICFAFSLLLLCNFAGARAVAQIIDNADIINDTETLNAEISEISQKYSTIIIIETRESLGGKDPDRLARDRFFELGLDRDGITVLNVFILYAKEEKAVRIVHARNCGYDEERIDYILTNLTYGLERKEYDAFLDAVKYLEGEIEERITEGLACPVKIKAEGQKDMSLYANDTVFLVSDEDWRDILRLVPVTIWSRDGEACQDIYAYRQGIKRHICAYPLLIYHREGDGFDADSVMLFLEQYRAKKVLVAGEPPQDLVNLLGVTVGKDNAKRIEPGDYARFWTSYKQAVVVEDDYRTAMMASSYASYINAPLFVADKDFSPGLLEGKELICIGSVTGLGCKERFSLEGLQKEYKRLAGSSKVILVNPDDIKDEYCEYEGFNNVNKIYCHDSLIAAYLAAAKDEVIIYSPGSKLNEIKSWFRRTINSNSGLFKDYRDVKYLTAIAGYKAIDTGSAMEDGYSTERQLLDFEGGPEEEITFGRIMGITIADTSSYIMRAIFYERLYNTLYGSERPGLMAIGHSFDVDQEFLPAFITNITSEYNAECYVQEEGYRGDICKKGVRPPIEGYGHKNIILFMDRGGADRWEYTLNYNEIPDLDLSVGIAQASLTNSYASTEYKHRLFGTNFIRKGGIGYYGAISAAAVDDVLSPASLLGYIAVHYLIEEGKDLGRIMKHAIRNMNGNANKKTYILLGDPSLNPGLPQADITYYPGTGGETE